MFKDKIFKYYFWVVFSIAIPVIVYIVYPGVDGIPSTIKTALILFVYILMRKKRLVAYNLSNKYFKLMLVVILLGIIHSFLTNEMNRLNLALLVLNTISWFLVVMVNMVSNVSSIGYFVRAFIYVMIPTAVFSGYYWYGFFAFDVPHILTQLSLCLLISPFFSRKMQIVLIGALISGVIFDYSVRSCLLTALVTISLYLCYKFVSDQLFEKIAKWARVSFFVAPVVFVILGVTGTFNIFADFAEQDFSEIPLSNGRKSESHTFNVDSRTAVYYDVLLNTRDVKDVLIGHGAIINLDSLWIETRHSVEAGMLNMFYRYGLIGCFVIFLLLWYVTKLGMYHSNNRLTMMAALYLSYKFLLSFVDDANIDVSTYIAMGICLNSYIRSLSDNDLSVLLSKVKLI